MTNQPLEERLDEILWGATISATQRADILTLIDEARIEELQTVRKKVDNLRPNAYLASLNYEIDFRIAELKKKGKR